MEIANELDSKFLEMRTHFLVQASEGKVFAEFDAASSLTCPKYKIVADAFRHNIASAVSTVALPFTFAYASVLRSHFQRFHTAAYLRSRIHKWDDSRTYAEAKSKMDEFVNSEKGRNVLEEHTWRFLLESLEYDGMESDARELVQQGLVLLWSGFEVLCRDTFEILLNEEPEKVRVLTTNASTRQRFEAEKVPLHILVQHGFDLSGRLGTVLVSQQDFSDLKTIKSVYSVLFPNASGLNEALGNRHLWTLYQRRHLLVHRRGVIDQVYLSNTGAIDAVGTRLVVTPKDFECALTVVVSAGTSLLRSLPSN